MPQPQPTKPLIDRVSFDSKEHALDGFEVWHSLTSPFFDIRNLNRSADYQTQFEFCDLNGLCFNQVSYGATRYERNRQHLRNGDTDLLVLHLLLEGQEAITLDDGSEHLMTPDRIVLHDWSRPFHSQATPTNQISVSIPRHLIPQSDRLHANEAILSWDLQDPSGHMLATALKQIWKNTAQIKQADASSIASGFIGMLNGFVDSRLSSQNYVADASPITGSIMRTYLLRHLSKHDLNIDHLLEAFNTSPATIYRLFKDCGGVNAYIREQRLNCCRNELQYSQGQRTVKAIAESYGFHDPGYFHRIFKRKFGMTPKEASHPDPQQRLHNAPMKLAQEEISAVHNWIRNDYVI